MKSRDALRRKSRQRSANQRRAAKTDHALLGVSSQEWRPAVIRRAASRHASGFAGRLLHRSSDRTTRQLAEVSLAAYHLLDPRRRTNPQARAHVGRILPQSLLAADRTVFAAEAPDVDSPDAEPLDLDDAPGEVIPKIFEGDPPVPATPIGIGGHATGLTKTETPPRIDPVLKTNHAAIGTGAGSMPLVSSLTDTVVGLESTATLIATPSPNHGAANSAGFEEPRRSRTPSPSPVFPTQNVAVPSPRRRVLRSLNHRDLLFRYPPGRRRTFGRMFYGFLIMILIAATFVFWHERGRNSMDLEQPILEMATSEPTPPSMATVDFEPSDLDATAKLPETLAASSVSQIDQGPPKSDPVNEATPLESAPTASNETLDSAIGSDESAAVATTSALPISDVAGLPSAVSKTVPMEENLAAEFVSSANLPRTEQPTKPDTYLPDPFLANDGHSTAAVDLASIARPNALDDPSRRIGPPGDDVSDAGDDTRQASEWVDASETAGVPDRPANAETVSMSRGGFSETTLPSADRVRLPSDVREHLRVLEVWTTHSHAESSRSARRQSLMLRFAVDPPEAVIAAVRSEASRSGDDFGESLADLFAEAQDHSSLPEWHVALLPAIGPVAHELTLCGKHARVIGLLNRAISWPTHDSVDGAMQSLSAMVLAAEVHLRWASTLGEASRDLDLAMKSDRISVACQYWALVRRRWRETLPLMSDAGLIRLSSAATAERSLDEHATSDQYVEIADRWDVIAQQYDDPFARASIAEHAQSVRAFAEDLAEIEP